MIWVGLPAYNEQARIKTLLIDIDNDFKKVGMEYKIVVYNDGSSDNTASRVTNVHAEGVNVQLINGEKNRGLGYALGYLLLHFSKVSSAEDIVIIMDADATHSPRHIHRMLSYIQDGFDVVIASRYTPYSRIIGVKFYRQLLSNIASVIFRLLFPIRGVYDYTCAYRAYTAKILKLAERVYIDKLVEECGFSCMVEVLIKLRKLNIIACEVPLILRYDKKVGSSAMNVIATILGTLKLIYKSFFLSNPLVQDLRGFKEKYEL